MEDKIKEAVRVYDKIVKVYSKYHYDQLLQYQLTKFSSLLKGTKVLDAGCGPGRDVEYFMEDGLDVVGIDLSKKMIEEAKKNVPKGKFKVMDFRKMKFKDKSFDGIWGMVSLVHVDKKEIEGVLNEFNRVLGEKGVLYLAVYEGKGKKEVKKPEYENEVRIVYLYNQKEMEKFLMESGFDVVVSEVNSDQDKKWLEVFAVKR